MPDLLILIGTLGGLFLFGPIGFIVGTDRVRTIPNCLDNLRRDLQRCLPPVKSLRTTDANEPEAP